MGLDIALGVVILASAIRGWFRGFVMQAIRLGSLVGWIYAAAPVRDAVRPHVNPYLPTIRAELLDRLLWWLVAVLGYIITVGLIGLAVRMARRRPFGEPEPNRTDQFAGLVLGGLKGAVVVAFVAAGLHRYAVARVQGIGWAEEQAKGSYALKWDAQYHPADHVWTSAPVQHLVAEVRRKGLLAPAESTPAPDAEKPVQAASAGAPPRLDLVPPPLDFRSPEFARELGGALDRLAPADR